MGVHRQVRIAMKRKTYVLARTAQLGGSLLFCNGIGWIMLNRVPEKLPCMFPVLIVCVFIYLDVWIVSAYVGHLLRPGKGPVEKVFLEWLAKMLTASNWRPKPLPAEYRQKPGSVTRSFTAIFFILWACVLVWSSTLPYPEIRTVLGPVLSCIVSILVFILALQAFLYSIGTAMGVWGWYLPALGPIFMADRKSTEVNVTDSE